MANYVKSSFLDDFELPQITHETIKSQLIKVGSNRNIRKSNSIEKMPLDERLKYIESEVLKVLGRYKGFVKVIRDENEFIEYIDKAIKID